MSLRTESNDEEIIAAGRRIRILHVIEHRARRAATERRSGQRPNYGISRPNAM